MLRKDDAFPGELNTYLGVAQLVARYLGVVEAAGSSPVTQTKKSPTSTCLSDFFVALQYPKLYEVITKVITKTNCIHLFSYVLICNEGESLSDPHLFLKF